jgi:hypothetical protein
MYMIQSCPKTLELEQVDTQRGLHTTPKNSWKIVTYFSFQQWVLLLLLCDIWLILKLFSDMILASEVKRWKWLWAVWVVGSPCIILKSVNNISKDYKRIERSRTKFLYSIFKNYKRKFHIHESVFSVSNFGGAMENEHYMSGYFMRRYNG